MAIAMNDILGYSYTQSKFIDLAEQKLAKSVEMMYKVLNIEEKDLDRRIKKKLKDRNKVKIFADEKAEFIYDKLKGLGDTLVDKLVLNTVLNTADVKLMKSKVKKLPALLSQNRTNEKIYNSLVNKKLAIPQEVMKSAYLPELFASVLYSHGRMYFYKSERPKSKTNTFISNIHLASALCKKIEKETTYVVLHSILTQRNGLVYLYSEETDEFGEEKDNKTKLKDLYKGKGEYEELSKRTDKEEWFQHGILKVTKNDPFHKCKCLEKGIYICTEILKLEHEKEKRETIIKEGTVKIEEFMKILKEEETESKLHKAADFFVVTAEFYAEAKCFEDASKVYKEAIERCKTSDILSDAEWKQYGKWCLGLMRVAKQKNTKKAVSEAEEVVEDFCKNAPKELVEKLGMRK
ncbi:unnamed protein product [Owenia fusiformis]|uniref:Uncharacterized protein n=1 Tax=Owenia fusiformis TaxID=6347 RepID=A0A8S4N8J0_OWEFU|nr:unnamed protein product [Owenia fusiformis]